MLPKTDMSHFTGLVRQLLRKHLSGSEGKVCLEKSDYGRNIVVKELGCSVEAAARASSNKQFKFTMHAPAVFATLRTALGISEEDFLSVTPNSQTLLKLRKTIQTF